MSNPFDWVIQHIFFPIWEFIKPLLQSQLQQALSDALPIAMQVVLDVAAQGAANQPVDINAEIKMVADRLAMVGKSIAYSTITLAISMAVKKLQDDGKIPVSPVSA